jgi:uncharacterized protein
MVMMALWEQAIELLCAARLCRPVVHSAGNGLPLSAETKASFKKLLLLDAGLVHAWLETPATTIYPRWETLTPVIRGQLMEQMIGQQLSLLGNHSGDRMQLHYWQRGGSRAGEIDYLQQFGGRVVPIEIKAGSAGAMKSLHQFMADKRLTFAVRIDQNPPSQMTVAVKTTQGDQSTYQLLSLPPYLVHRLPELL